MLAIQTDMHFSVERGVTSANSIKALSNFVPFSFYANYAFYYFIQHIFANEKSLKHLGFRLFSDSISLQTGEHPSSSYRFWKSKKAIQNRLHKPLR